MKGSTPLNLNQPGSTDLNFANAPKFTLGSEDRPVFVNPSSIVPTTGAVSPVDARVTDAFGRVVNSVSDLKSYTRQGIFTLTPDLQSWGLNNFYTSLGYTLSEIRAEQRGFDVSTFGSPTTIEWSRGDLDARHQFLLQAGYGRNGINFTMQGRLQSGTPFTPMVGSDINGDGLANDRAFIYNPNTVADPTLATGLRSLLASSTPNVRSCLVDQMGQGAARNSCEGPWTAALNARIGLSGRALHFGNRVDVGLNLANPLGGLDQLVHGANNLKGWGTPALPNPVLYTVRGFDPNTNNFLYNINPRFGSTSPTNSTIRAPFRMTLDVSVDIGRPSPSSSSTNSSSRDATVAKDPSSPSPTSSGATSATSSIPTSRCCRRATHSSSRANR